MSLPIDRWHSAIVERVSTRTYSDRPVPEDDLNRLTEAADLLHKIVPSARAVIVSRGSSKLYKGIVGSYGAIRGAQGYAVFIGDTSRPDYQEAVGYLGEGIILEATALGLSTCWVGGFFRPEAVTESITLMPAEKVLAITPIGYAADRPSLGDRLVKGLARSRSRKSLEEICPPLGVTSVPNWIRKGLEAARVAPSAVNRQPWRFSVSADKVVLSADSPHDGGHISKRLDCGIAALHFELGARHAGWTGSWAFAAPPEVAVFWS